MMVSGDYFDDDEDEDEDLVVRSFMVTNGRTTARATELPIETLVSVTTLGQARAADLRFEARRIVTEFHAPTGLAEISAILSLPLRATQILVSELVEDGFLTQHETIDNADIDLLLRIRAGLLRL